MSTLTSIAKQVREVFLVPPDLGPAREEILASVESAPQELRLIADAFAENLVGVVRTLSIPFQYTHSEVSSLHWQRIHMAERIRALGPGDEPVDEKVVFANARTKFVAFQKESGHDKIIGDVLDRLLRLKEGPESLAAARELTRQGVVLVWSAVEVLARDAFVYLLDRHPTFADVLLSDAANRKRFAVERVDWQTLSSFGFDMSHSLGRFLISRADLKNVPALRTTYQALFPSSVALHDALADRRIWSLSQKRHLIVHRRGVVDREYLDATDDTLKIGDTLWVVPADIEAYVEAARVAGRELLREVANAA